MSKDKIIDFKGSLDDFARHPELLATGNVIRISPLPKFEHIDALISAAQCKKCASKNLALISYEISDKVSAAFARCTQCHEPTFAFFGEGALWSADILIVVASAKDDEYRKQLQNSNCSVCTVKYEILYKRDSKDYDIQRIVPMQAKCPSCNRILNIIFWDSPRYYFDRALALADEVSSNSPRAGLVFLVSALETFLQKGFLFQSTTNKFLIERRKVNSQSLQEAQDIYLEFMKIDLASLVSAGQWNILAKAIQDRHGLIHNAGFDKRFEPIIVDPANLPTLRTSVVELVTKLSDALEARALL